MHPMHATSQQLRRFLTEADTLGLSEGARQRLRWFLHYAERDRSIGETCQHFGISRSTFHRWANRFDFTDPRTLEEQSRRPHHVRGTTAAPEVVERVREYRMRWPLIGKESIAQMLRDEWGMTVSSSMVGRIIDQFGFYFADTPLHRKKRALHDPARSAALPPLPERPQHPDAFDAYAFAAPRSTSHELHRGTPQSHTVQRGSPPSHTVQRGLPPSHELRRGSPHKRALIVASLLTNFAFIAFLLGMAGWESRRTAYEAELRASAGSVMETQSGNLLYLEVTRMDAAGVRHTATQDDIDQITRYFNARE